MSLMKTLVLGHGRLYGIDVRCSPLPLVDWINDEYTCVDWCEDVEPDLLYDLSVIPWTFAQDEEYDRIIDTCGMAIQGRHGCQKIPVDEVMRILKRGGVYHDRSGKHVKN